MSNVEASPCVSTTTAALEAKRLWLATQWLRAERLDMRERANADLLDLALNATNPRVRSMATQMLEREYGLGVIAQREAEAAAAKDPA